MKAKNRKKLKAYVAKLVREFRKSMLDSIKQERSLEEVANYLVKKLSSKNPFLYRSFYGDWRSAIRAVYADWVSSSRETKFGQVIEKIAIYLASESAADFDVGQRKSSTTGIDIDIVRNGVRHLVSVKSGVKWGNSQSIAKQAEQFKEAKKKVKAAARPPTATMGVGYGNTKSIPGYADLQVVGQDFWTFLSGDPQMHLFVFNTMGEGAEAFDAKWNAAFDQAVMRACAALEKAYADDDSDVWEHIFRANSDNYCPGDTQAAYIELLPECQPDSKIEPATVGKSSRNSQKKRRD